MKQTILIKFGGSIMAPFLPDIEYLTKFKAFVLKLLPKYRFILITGGGGINSKYNEIAKNIHPEIKNADLDWIGIYTTRLNAKLLVGILGDICEKKIVCNPMSEVCFQKDVLVGAGWKPGWSTDYDSMILAKKFGVSKILIATNTDFVFDKDPHVFKDAKPQTEMSWEILHQMVGDKWTPRMHIPLDPSAIRYGRKNKLNVISLNGKDLANMELAIEGKKFKGTVIK